MRISTGLSEVQHLASFNNRVSLEKEFLWPVYNAGKVDRIRSVSRRTESNIVYSKPTQDEQKRLMALSLYSKETEYTAQGEIRKYSALTKKPGSFFNALV